MIFHPALPLSAPEFWFFAYFFSLAEEERGGEGRGETQMNRKTEKGGGGSKHYLFPTHQVEFEFESLLDLAGPPGGGG